MFYDTGSSSMDYSNRMTSLCGICFPGDVVPWLLAGIWRNPDQNERTNGSDTPLWDSGEERHRGELANWHRNDTETRQSDRGTVGMKSWLFFTASSLVSTIKICQTKNFAGWFGFSKNQRKWERLSVRGKNGKEKPLLHGLLASM